MSHNSSPWLQQITKPRLSVPLLESTETDILVVGAGIAGITTAYYLLKDTQKKVVLLEADKIAHGATGHNAGQVVAYFERPFDSIAAEFGLELAVKGLDGVRSAWELLETMSTECKLDVPLNVCTGYAGCSSKEQLLLHLENKYLRSREGLDIENIFVSEEHCRAQDIPEKYHTMLAFVPHQKILDMLESKDARYIAALTTKKGCLNSALFCSELLSYMEDRFGSRLKVFEHSPMETLILEKEKAVATCGPMAVIAKQVVLCTNGFEKFTIVNTSGQEIDSSFHESVYGLVGFMAGYLEAPSKPAVAISYFVDGELKKDASYFYVTRRKYELQKGEEHDLICIGGPERMLSNKKQYKKTEKMKHETLEEITSFLQNTYGHAPEKYKFMWHGLMGYTKNMLRMIGPDPRNNTLLYNLGCNGVGILTSVYGAKRISYFVQNGILDKSIFDVVL